MVKKAQIAIEYMILAVFGMLVISLTVYTIYSRMGKQTSELETAQLKNFGNSIIKATNKLGYMGDQSKITLRIILPDNVEYVYVENDKDLVFHYQGAGGGSDMVFHSNLNLALDFDDFNPGVKNMVLEARDDYILICSQTEDSSCNEMCDISKGETPYDDPNDCCKSDCTGCLNDDNFYFCKSDNLCHASCDNHNDCNAQCDWNGSKWINNICYNCTLSCQWGNQKPCPKFCVNETQGACGTDSYNHHPGLLEYCNFGYRCNPGSCSYSSNTTLDLNYCYSCSTSGATQGDPCPASGTLSDNICYYGDERNCTGSSLLNCTLENLNMTENYEYYSLLDGNPSWRLDDEGMSGLSVCEWGPDSCTPTGSGLTNNWNCPAAGYKDALYNCYYDPDDIDGNRSDDCTTGGCTIINESCYEEGFCDSLLGCI